MTGLEIGCYFFVLLIVLILLRMPIGLAMMLVGGIGYVVLSGWGPLIAFLKTSLYSRAASESFVVIPLFILMGQFAIHSGLTRSLFQAARAWFGHWRGGIAIAALGSCAAFGTICGSSTATAATMAQISLPELKRHGYSNSLSTGTLAVGGSLGILIPPSITLVIYAALVEQSILDLFRAAAIPGILALVGYIITIMIVVRVWPTTGAALEKLSWSLRFKSLTQVLPAAAIFFLMMGGIYLGWFSVNEGAAVGVVATGITALFSGMRWKELRIAFLETAKISGFLFMILIGAELFNSFLALAQLPKFLAAWIAQSAYSPVATVTAMIVFYLLLSSVMDELAMILLTMPVFTPILLGLNFGMSPDAVLVWFGILALAVVGIGLVAPPIGLNVFIIHSLAKDVSIAQIYRGAIPFVAADLIRLTLLILIPSLSLWLPGLR